MTVVEGDNIRASARFSMDQGQDHVNVYYFQAGVSYSETDEDTVGYIHDHIEALYSNMTTVLSNTASPVDMKTDLVEFIGGKEEITRNLGTVPLILSFDPAATGDPLPPGTAGLLKLLTTIGKVYGRKFFGMLVEQHQVSGVLSSVLLTALDVVGGLMIANISTPPSGVIYPGVMSKRESVFVPFAAYDVSSNVAYQRRRRMGSGS